MCNYICLPATVKVLETFMEAILSKSFQLFHCILKYVSSITNMPSHHCWFQSREQVKISCSQVRRVQGMLQCCHIVLYQEIVHQNWPVCCSIVMKEKQTVGSPFTGTFPSDCIPKVTKDVNVQLFIHSFTFRDELIMDNALPALPFLYSHQLKIFASRWWWFHSEDCCFVCGSYKKHHVSSPLSMLRTLLSFTNHIKEVTRNAHLCFFLFRHQHSRYQRWKKKIMFNTSWRILWWLPTEIPTSDAIWSTDFLLSLLTTSYTHLIFASAVDIEGWPLYRSSSTIL